MLPFLSFAAFVSFVLSIGAFFVMIYLKQDVTFVCHQLIALATAATLFSFLLSLYLYLRSFSVPSDELAEGGDSGESSIKIILVSVVSLLKRIAWDDFVSRVHCV